MSFLEVCVVKSTIECTSKEGHDWVVFSTALAELCLMVQCVNCGLHGTVDDPSQEEWDAAFHAPSAPYRWHGGAARVTQHPDVPRGGYVSKADGVREN
jgi:hypothetical protein